MDQLLPGQEMMPGQHLMSPNGWLTLELQGDGNLVLYRTQPMIPLWASHTAGQPIARLTLQGDGNLVLYRPDSTAAWDSHTHGNAVSKLLLQDDGNLVLYRPDGSVAWASNTVVDFSSLTIKTTDSRGFSSVATSETLKGLASGLPCFWGLQWPGYATDVVETTINGEPVVVQLWKGWCQKVLATTEVPGGVGAEVGVYRRVPGRGKPLSIPFLPRAAEDVVLAALASVPEDELWWPAPDLQARLTWTLTNPVNGDVFLRAGPETSYWLTKWMNEWDYVRYLTTIGGPWDPASYTLDYTINDTIVGHWEGTAPGSSIRGPGAPVAVSRSANRLDVFRSDTDGRVHTAAWAPDHTDGWHGWWAVGNLDTPGGTPVNAVVRSPDHLDLFATGTDGIIRTAAWAPDHTDGWHGWWPIRDGRAAPGAPVTAVSRRTDHLDIFVTGTDGRVWTAAWNPSNTDGWHGWWPIGDLHVPMRTPINAVVRSPDHLDLFATGTDGIIRTAAWAPDHTDGWHGWWPIRDGRAAPGAPVTAVSRRTDHLDIFVTGTDGRVWTAAWNPSNTDGWHGWWPIGDLHVPMRTPINAVVRSPDHLDLFATGTDGIIRTAAWAPDHTDGWHGWWPIRDGRAAPGAPVTAVSRRTDHLDIFVTGTDGRVWTAAWNPSNTDGWHGWWPIR